jgi:hypothetical protein
MIMPSNTYYLPIRSFGDFVITASVVKFNAGEKVPIVLPEYFTALFDAIEGEKYFEVAKAINLDNQPTFFEMYKVRSIRMLKKLLADYRNLAGQLDKKATYLLDFSSKRISFIGPRFVWPASDSNIYDAKLQMLGKSFRMDASGRAGNEVTLAPQIKKVVVFPESRVAQKAIDKPLLDKIVNKFGHIEIIIARFSAEKSKDSNIVHYSNFHQLISLINGCDLVISSESLPYHLAHYYSKPHFVLYKVSKHFNHNFMTASMVKNGYYAIHDGQNDNEILEKLSSVLVAN